MWKKFGTMLCASAMVLTLAGCGGSEQPEEDSTFVVGMECAYAPFNWQSSNQTDSSVLLESGGYADGYDVMIAKNIADQLGKELVIKPDPGAGHRRHRCGHRRHDGQCGP
mgnify:CR=1 FL=1